MKSLSQEEIHGVLLEIAKNFAATCDKNGIPYYMLGGTMLGAVRHHGIIPWDDDMDFGVPREYYQKMIEVLNKELPTRYECGTYLNNVNVQFPFVKIHDKRTKSDNLQQHGNVDTKIGVNIDIFPLDLCDKTDKHVSRVIRLFDFYGRVFTNSATGSNMKNIIKKKARLLVPGNRISWCGYIEKCSVMLRKGDYLANLYGTWKEKEIIPVEWFGDGTLYDFGDTKFRGVEQYDKYLSHLYGDYMKLPPENKRHFHSSNYYEIL